MNIKRMYRKPRKTSRNMCEVCGNIACDPMWSSRASRKIQERNRKGICCACGATPCICKRKGMGLKPMRARRVVQVPRG
jgi:hypothetical protein